MSKMLGHLHRYKKIDIGGADKEYFVYRCTKPTCNHYVPIAQAEGKMCECNRCGEPMLITKEVLQGSQMRALTLPHCSDCKKPASGVAKKKKENVAAIAEFLAKKTDTGT